MAFYDIDLNEKTANRHELYQIKQTVDLSRLTYRVKHIETKLGRSGYGIDVGLACIFLQFFYDLSDREMEKRLRFDMAFLWFCGLSAYEHLRSRRIQTCLPSRWTNGVCRQSLLFKKSTRRNDS